MAFIVTDNLPKTDLYCMPFALKELIIHECTREGSDSRACISRAEDPIAELDAADDLFEDVAEDVAEGVPMVMVVFATIETPS